MEGVVWFSFILTLRAFWDLSLMEEEFSNVTGFLEQVRALRGPAMKGLKN